MYTHWVFFFRHNAVVHAVGYSIIYWFHMHWENRILCNSFYCAIHFIAVAWSQNCNIIWGMHIYIYIKGEVWKVTEHRNICTHGAGTHYHLRIRMYSPTWKISEPHHLIFMEFSLHRYDWLSHCPLMIKSISTVSPLDKSLIIGLGFLMTRPHPEAINGPQP